MSSIRQLCELSAALVKAFDTYGRGTPEYTKAFNEYAIAMGRPTITMNGDKP